MQIDVSDAGVLRKQITVTYSSEEYQQRQDEMLARYASQANLKGFRNGKAPKSVVAKRYGNAVKAEAADQLINDAIRQAMRDHELQPVGPLESGDPQFDDGISYSVSFDLRPEVPIPDPEQLTIVSEPTEATDEEMQQEIDEVLYRAGSQRELGADDPLIERDSITLSGTITAGEEKVRDVHDLNHCLGAYPLFGKPEAEVLELTADKKVGDTLAFDTTLPDTFRPEEWAGKEARVEVVVQKAERQEPATLDKDLFERFGVEDEEAFRARVRENIESRKQNEQRQRQTQELTDQLISECQFALPEKLVNDLTANQTDQAVARAKAETEDDFDEDAARAEREPESRESVERYLRRSFILGAIASANDIEATQQDLQQQIMMAAYQSGQNPQDIVKNLQESGQLEQVAGEIREAKALEFFLARVLGEDPNEEAQAAAASSGSESEG